MKSSPPRTDIPADEPGGDGVRLEVVAGLVILAIAAFFGVAAGEGTLDWTFPTSLSYATGTIGVVLVVRGLLGFGHRRAVPPILRGRGLDVTIFIATMAVFVVAIIPLGFWPASTLMIFVAAVYLAPNRSRRSILTAAATAVTVVVLAYLLLAYVFYVPFPRARWLPFGI